MTATAIKNTELQKATMIMENSMGITVMWHIWLKEVYTDDNRKKTIVIYKEKGKRKVQGWGYPSDNQICFAKGWQQSNILTNKVKSSFIAPKMISFDNTFQQVINEMKNVLFLKK